MKYLLFFIAFIGGIMLGNLLGLMLFNSYNFISKSKHICSYQKCSYKDKTTFTNNLCVCDPGSDCNALDSIHFVHPTWTYDECEKFLFTPISNYDYKIRVHFDTLWLYNEHGRLVGKIDYTKEKLDSLIYKDNE